MREATCTRSCGWYAHHRRKLRHDTRIHTISYVPTYTHQFRNTHDCAFTQSGFRFHGNTADRTRGVGSPGMFVGQISLQDKLCSTPQVSPRVFLRKISPVSTNNPTTSTDPLPLSRLSLRIIVSSVKISGE